MITTRFYLDCRAVSRGSSAPLRLAITSNSVRAFVPLGISLLPAHWDAKLQRVVGHPQKAQLNSLLTEKKLAVDTLLFRLVSAGELAGLRPCQIKDRVMAELYPAPAREKKVPGVADAFRSFMRMKQGRTVGLYRYTVSRIVAWLGEEKWETLKFEDVTVAWLGEFDAFLARTAPSRNSRNINLRNIRAVFNFAIDNEMTSCYPFRRFKLRPQPTQKRAMSIAELRKIATAPLPPHLARYRDLWMLSFMLLGINVVDLCSLREVDGMGRVQYIRAKTHKPYSIKVEPEALALIEAYRGKGQLLYMLDRHRSYRTFYMQMCRGLSGVRDALNAISDGVVIRELTTYWARHTWATVAASLDIPKETIAAALGHGGNTVTDIYIDFDRSKVDRANRRVLDWVLYGKE